MTTTTTTTTDEAEQLRREIELRRAGLGRDLEALGDHVSPGRMVQRRRNAAGRRWRGMKSTLMGSTEDVADRATSAGSAVTERASAMADTVAGSIGHMPDEAMQRTRGTPLAMGLISFAVGFAAAAALPATRREEQMASRLEPDLRRVAEEAGSMAREGADKIAPVAKQAAVDLREDAMEAGRAVQERAQSGMADVKAQGRAGAEDVSGEADGWA